MCASCVVVPAATREPPLERGARRERKVGVARGQSKAGNARGERKIGDARGERKAGDARLKSSSGACKRRNELEECASLEDRGVKLAEQLGEPFPDHDL